MLKYVLLGALSYQPLTGYQLKQFVDNTTKHFWFAQTSQIYRTLKEIEEAKLAVSEVQEQDKRPDRRLYHITQTGRDDLKAWLIQPMTTVEPTKDALVIRLFFAKQMDKDSLLTQLKLQRTLHQQQLLLYRTEIIQQIETSRAQHPELDRDAQFWDMARRNGELAEEYYIRWLDETIQRIEAMPD